MSTSTSYLSKSGLFFRILSKPCRLRAIRKATFAVLCGEDDILPYSYNNGAASGKNVISDEQVLPKRVHVNSNGGAFGTPAAEITPTTRDFFPNEDVYDLDVPTEGFSSIPEAIEDVRQGKVGASLLVNLFVIDLPNQNSLLLICYLEMGMGLGYQILCVLAVCYCCR